MALPFTTVFEVRDGGSDSQCSGGFNAARGGTDYTLQTSAQATGTVSVSGTTCTATTGIFTAAMVGNTITDGTSIREITAFTSSTVVTLNATVSWTAATVYVGGALASPGKAGSYQDANGQIIYIKYSATPYSLSTSTPGASGPVATTTSIPSIIGYDTTRTMANTDANRATLKATTTGVTVFQPGTSWPVISNLIVDGNNQTSATLTNNSTYFTNCLIKNMKGGSGGAAYLEYCEVTGCAASQAAGAFASTFHGNTATPNGTSASSSFVRCLSYANTGASTDGFSVGATQTCVECVAYGNGRAGFSLDGNRVAAIINCVAEGNGGYGFVNNSGLTSFLINCASYNNTSGRSNGTFTNIGGITGSGSFFTDAASGDFSPNNTAGAGALLRAAGVPATYPGSSTANYQDAGAAQSQASGGTAGGFVLGG